MTPFEKIFKNISREYKEYSKLKYIIAEALTTKRESLKMSQRQFARHIEIKPSLVEKYENGEYDFTLFELVKIFSAAKIDFALFIDLRKDLENETKK